MTRALHLFYQNLRVQDNPSLEEAARQEELLALYVLQEKGKWAMAAASKVWLYESLKALGSDLKEKGIYLHLAKGDLTEVLTHYVKKCAITDIYFDMPVGPKLFNAVLFEKKGVKVHLFHSSLLFDPDLIRTKQGSPFQVFTPFYKCSQKAELSYELGGNLRLKAKPIKSSSLELEALHLKPKVKWDTHFKDQFEMGEKGAKKALKRFLETKINAYAKDRDYLDREGSSRLSAHLHFGEIAPRRVYESLKGAKEEPFKRQLIWREFAHHLLYHFPNTLDAALKEDFNDFPWEKNSSFLRKWQQGLTGVPIVDAGMRELWQTGWMHNRARMIVGSFLVKDLMISWKEGAKWFWDTLVDADLANNTLGWQWVAGCGADAAPYFRIFNPYTQSLKFDPEGEYIRRFVPELKYLETKYIHAPHLAPQEKLSAAGVILGKNYPFPLVDHDEARKNALKIYHRWKG